VQTDVRDASDVEESCGGPAGQKPTADCTARSTMPACFRLPCCLQIWTTRPSTMSIAVDLKGIFLCMKYEIQQMLQKWRWRNRQQTRSVAGMIADPRHQRIRGGEALA